VGSVVKVSPIGEEQLRLKQRARRRLIGAVALVLLFIVALPMVLDKEPKQLASGIAVEIPAKSPQPAVSQSAAPVPEAAPQEAEKPESAPEKTARAEPEQAPREPAPPPRAAAERPRPKPEPDRPAPRPESLPSAEHENASESFYVQVGVFSKPENARGVQAKLAKSSIRAVMDTVRTQAGGKTRVRVGPFASRAQADDALVRVRQAGERDAVVTAQEKGG
jgi:DedD protein